MSICNKVENWNIFHQPNTWHNSLLASTVIIIASGAMSATITEHPVKFQLPNVFNCNLKVHCYLRLRIQTAINFEPTSLIQHQFIFFMENLADLAMTDPQHYHINGMTLTATKKLLFCWQITLAEQHAVSPLPPHVPVCDPMESRRE